jgi:hypothetical protein
MAQIRIDMSSWFGLGSESGREDLGLMGVPERPYLTRVRRARSRENNEGNERGWRGSRVVVMISQTPVLKANERTEQEEGEFTSSIPSFFLLEGPEKVPWGRCIEDFELRADYIQKETRWRKHKSAHLRCCPAIILLWSASGGPHSPNCLLFSSWGPPPGTPWKDPGFSAPDHWMMTEQAITMANERQKVEAREINVGWGHTGAR